MLELQPCFCYPDTFPVALVVEHNSCMHQIRADQAARLQGSERLPKRRSSGLRTNATRLHYI